VPWPSRSSASMIDGLDTDRQAEGQTRRSR